MKKFFLIIIKLAISAALITYIFSKTDLAAIFQTLKSTSPFWLAAAFGLHIVGFTISAYRWKMLLKIQGIEAPASKLFLSYIVGQFFNFFLPTTVGGDLFRVYDTRVLSQGAGKSAVVILIERLSGFFALLVIASLAYFLGRRWIGPDPAIFLMMIFFMAAILAIILVFSGRWFLAALSYFSNFKIIPKKIKKIFIQITEVVQNFKTNWRAFGSPLFLAFLLQLNVAVHISFIALAVKIHLPLIYFFVLVPMVQVILMAPVSFGGIGLSENAYAFFLSRLGVPVYQAVALSLLSLALRLLIGTIGAIIYNLKK